MAPDFALSDASGKVVKLSALRGKVVLLNFWATWCGGCKLEIPWLMDFQRNYKDRDFVVLGISLDDDGWKAVKPFVEQKKLNYRVVVGNGELAKLYRSESMPTTVLVDREGRIAASHGGVLDRGVCEKEIRRLF